MLAGVFGVIGLKSEFQNTCTDISGTILGMVHNEDNKANKGLLVSDCFHFPHRIIFVQTFF